MFKSQSSSQPSKSTSSPPPSVRITVGRPAYRPGEQVIASIDVHNERLLQHAQARTPNGSSQSSAVADLQHAVLIKDVSVEIRGVEKVDPTWITTPKVGGSGGVRGERLILTTEATPLASNLLLKPGGTKTWAIRATLPKVLPPSYRGTALRYGYFIVVTVTYGPVVMAANDPGSSAQPSQSNPTVVERTPFRVWSVPGASGLEGELEDGIELYEDGGIVPTNPIKIGILSREKTARSNWIAAAEALSGGEEDEGDQPPRIETASSLPIEVPAKSPTLRATSLPVDRTPVPGASPTHLGGSPPPFFLGGVGAQSVPASRTQSNGTELADVPPTSRSDNGPPELERASSLDLRSLSAFTAGPAPGTLSRTDSDDASSPPPSPMLSAIRGRTYNIRIGDQLLVRFSPRNPEPVYTLGDAVSGTLDFSDHKPGERRCLKVSVTLETQEIVTPSVLHPSRRGPSGSQIIPKVQTEYHELSADLIHTHFIFTIPGDAPQSFTTPLVDVKWTLRFEFLASPGVETAEQNAGRRPQHERIERAEWAMPVLVHAPLPVEKAPAATKRRKGSTARKEREGGYQTASPNAKSSMGSPTVLNFGDSSAAQDDTIDESERENDPS